MRSAIFGDIHGNLVALDAVLADIDAQGGVDHYIVLGDLCALGGDPVGVVRRLNGLDRLTCVRGNTDRYLLSGELPPPPEDDEQLKLMIAGFNWSRQQLMTANEIHVLGALEVEQRFVAGSASVLVVHASPGTDEGRGFRPEDTDLDCRARLAGCDANVVMVGHTHVFVDRVVDGIRVFNPGSVSNHPPTEPLACYAVLETHGDGTYELTQHKVAYDKAKAISTLYDAGFPAADYIASQIGS